MGYLLYTHVRDYCAVVDATLPTPPDYTDYTL